MEALTSLSTYDLRDALLRQVKFKDIENSVLRQIKFPSPKQTSSSPLFLQRQVCPELADMLGCFMRGEYQAEAHSVKQRKIYHAPFCPSGINLSKYLEPLIKKARPVLIAVDASPAEIGAALRYAFSIYYGLEIPAKILLVKETSVKEAFMFYPGDFLPELSFFCFKNKLPLIALGASPRPVPSEYQFAYNKLLQEAYSRFSNEADKGAADKVIENVAACLMQQVFNTGINLSVEREDAIEQSCYLASRLFDALGYISSIKYKKGPVLTLYKMRHSLDFPSIVKTLSGKSLSISELYSGPETQSDGHYEIESIDNGTKAKNEQLKSSLSKKIKKSLEKILDKRMNEPLGLDEVDKISSMTAKALRTHHLIERPPGVRGTLAIREIAQGYGLITKKLTRQKLARASYIALRHRVRLKQGYDTTIEEIFKDIFSRFIYGIQLFPDAEVKSETKHLPLTQDQISKALMGLSDAAFRNLQPDEGLPVDDPAFSEEAMRHPLVQQALKDAMEKGLLKNIQQNYQDIINELEERNYLEMQDSSHLTLSKEGRQNIKKYLEDALALGNISPEELAEALNKARAMPAPSLAGFDKTRLKPQAETELLAEIMDFQHEGRASSSTLEDLYVHYTINENKGIKTSSEKVDYEKLKIILHQLEKKGLVSTSGDKKRFTLSHLSIEKLLEGLIRKHESNILEKRAFRREHETDKTEVRRYKRGDIFRDLSIRHTLRRIIRKGKSVNDINYSDLRSFEKKPSSQLDIAVCVDISASMKEMGKLRYAKMAVAELAKAAIKKQDRVGIVAFSNLGEIVVPLTDKINMILEATMTLRAEQYTNIGNGLGCARKMLLNDKKSNPKYIILITDGQPNAALSDDYNRMSYHKKLAEFSRQTTMETKQTMGTSHALMEAVKTRRKNIKISVVFISPEGKEDEGSEKTAREIARIGSGRFHKVKSVDRLPLEVLAAVG